MMTKKIFSTLFAAILPLGLSLGCTSFAVKDKPLGYIEVSDYVGYKGAADLRMKAPDNVGLSIKTFDNYEGGSLSLWSEDLVKKLGARGYVLTGQKPVTSANGVVGTRFDFRYIPHGADEEKYYTALLFVTDDWRIVVQFAGSSNLASTHEADVTALLAEIKVRGCKLGEKTCDGPQAKTLATPPENLIALEDRRKAAAEKDTDEGGSSVEPTKEPEPAPAPEPTPAPGG